MDFQDSGGVVDFQDSGGRANIQGSGDPSPSYDVYSIHYTCIIHYTVYMRVYSIYSITNLLCIKYITIFRCGSSHVLSVRGVQVLGGGVPLPPGGPQ